MPENQKYGTNSPWEPRHIDFHEHLQNSLNQISAALTLDPSADEYPLRDTCDRVLAEKVTEIAELARREGSRHPSKPILVYVTGPAGVGKTTFIENELLSLLQTDSDEARHAKALAGIPETGVTADSFFVISGDIMKKAIWLAGGLSHLPYISERFDQLHSPAERSIAVDFESFELEQAAIKRAMSEECNIVFEDSMSSLGLLRSRALLEEAGNLGYQRVAVSIEKPPADACWGSSCKWREGRVEFEEFAGFGATLTPHSEIQAAYSSDGVSKCRRIVERLACTGFIDSVIAVDPGSTAIRDPEYYRARPDAETAGFPLDPMASVLARPENLPNRDRTRGTAIPQQNQPPLAEFPDDGMRARMAAAPTGPRRPRSASASSERDTSPSRTSRSPTPSPPGSRTGSPRR